MNGWGVAIAASGGSLLERIRRLGSTDPTSSRARHINAWLAGVVVLAAMGAFIGVVSQQQILAEAEGVGQQSAVPVLEFRFAKKEQEEGFIHQKTVLGGDRRVFVSSEAVMTDRDIKAARAVGRPPKGRVLVKLTDEAAARFAELTKANIGETLAILVRGEVVLAPTIRDEIKGGVVQIEGNFTMDEAEELAAAINGSEVKTRTLHFPEDRSLGRIHLSTIEEEAALGWIEWGSPWERQFVADAKGAVSIPEDMFTTLFVSSAGWQDLSPLSALDPDALDGIVINPSTLPNGGDILSGRIPKASPHVLDNICHLTGLQLLVWNETSVSNEELRNLTKLGSLERLALAADDGDEDALHLNDESLAIIGQLKSLKGLRIYTKVPISQKGFAHLSQLTHLRTIRIGTPNCRSNDFSFFSSLTALEEVSLMLGVLTSSETLMPLVSLPHLKDFDLHWGRESLEREALAPLAELSSVETLRLVCVEEEETLEIVSRMRSLKKLFMDLCADVPLSPLARLPDLRVLKIESRCTDRMLEGIEACPALKVFSAHSAGIGYTLREFTDAGVSRIAGIATLEEIELWSGNFTDAALQSLSQCQRLRRLIIPNNNGFTDEGMAYVAKLANLDELHLRGELLTLTGFERIASLKNLKALSLLTAWHLDDAGLEKLTLLTDLEKLKFSSRAATLAGLSRINVLKNLVELRAIGVQGGETVLQIPDLSRLERLHISSVSDRDLACMKGFKNLKSLDIAGPELTDRGLDHLRSLPSLRRLRLGPRTQVTDEALQALQRDMPGLQWDRTKQAPD